MDGKLTGQRMLVEYPDDNLVYAALSGHLGQAMHGLKVDLEHALTTDNPEVMRYWIGVALTSVDQSIETHATVTKSVNSPIRA